MPIFTIETPSGARLKIEAPDEATALQGAQDFEAGQAAPPSEPQHMDFDGSHIPGYNPETGMVERTGMLDKAGAFATGAIEGLPIAGPALHAAQKAGAAAMVAPFSDQSFGEIYGDMTRTTERVQADNPGATFAGNVTGAVAGTIPMVMAAPAAFGVGAGNLGVRMATSALTGGGIGGMDAAVRSGGDPDAIKSGARWGMALGAGGPAVGSMVGAGARKVAGWAGPHLSRAQQAFGRAAADDGIDDIGRSLGEMGPDAMPMDLGPNLQRQAGALANAPGRSQQTIRTAINDRQARSGQRIGTALDTALGQPVDTVAVADDIIARRSAAAKPLYDQAYSKPVPFTRALESLLTRPSVGKALRQAQRLAADEGIPSKQWFANIADDGKVTIRNVPDVRQLDLTKRALDDMIEAAKRSGNGNEARIYTMLKDQLVRMVDDAVPEYAAARKAFSGPSAVLDAIEDGQKAFSSTTTPNQLAKQLASMGEAEREAFTQGARAQVAQMMGMARNDALAARTAFQKGFNREKLEIIVGKEEAARLLRSLEAETAFTRTRDVVTQNSETAARLAAQQEIGIGPRQPGVFRSALNARFGDAVAGAGDKALRGARNARQARTNDELARMLTSKDPKSLQRTIKMVNAARKRGDISAQRAKEIINGAMIGASQRRRKPLEITVGPSR